MRAQSLKKRILLLLLPAMLFGMVLSIWSSSKVIEEQAEQAYDRSLAAVVLALDQNTSTDSGGLSLKQPYQLLNFFRLTASGNVYYRVGIEGGLVEIGFANLPLPHALETIPSNQVYFFNGDFLDGEPVRSAILVREMDPPIISAHNASTQSNRIYIQVAESLNQRNSYTREILKNVLLRDLTLTAFVTTLLFIAIHLAFRPIERLRSNLSQRSPDDLHPIAIQNLPKEVLPLVHAINAHMQRSAQQTQQQRQFLDDASHQLRTPLAVLRTKIDFALRENDPDEIRAALKSMRNGLDRAQRLTNQMLLLARAHDSKQNMQTAYSEKVNLNALIDSSVRLLWPAARAKKLRYELDLPEESIELMGSSVLLQEAFINLIDNAIKYCPEGSQLRIGLQKNQHLVTLYVQDSGEGMSAEDIAQAGIRFRRGKAGQGTEGAGLGLAIVATIAQAHGAKMKLISPAPPIAQDDHGVLRQKATASSAQVLPMPKPVGLRVELVFFLSSIAPI